MTEQPTQGRGPTTVTVAELRSAALILIVQPDGRSRWISHNPPEGVVEILIDVTAALQRTLSTREASDG